jgi:FHS family Na+ dependent glucose MFS transporter 1
MSLFWMLLGLLFLLGLAEANIDVGTNTLLPWLYRDQVSPYMNGLHFFFGLGAFLSPIIVAQTMLHTGGFRAAYWLPALLIMPLMVLLLRLPSPPPAEQEMGETAVAPPRYLAIILVILFLFLYVGVEASFGGWIFVYATELGLATATNAAYLTSAFWGSLTVGRLISIPLAARLRPRQVIAVALIGGLLSLSFIIGWRESSAALLIGVIGFGLAIAPIFPATLSLTDRNMSISGQITGWFFAGGSIGAMIWPVVMGQLIKFVSPYAIMLAMLILMLLAALVYALFLRELARFRPREDDPQTRFL